MCVPFLLHPEQSAAVHKASCYPRDRQLNDLLKACVSSVRHAFLLKINPTVSVLVNYSIFLLMQKKRKKKEENSRNCSFFLLSILDLYLRCDLSTVVPFNRLTPGLSKFAIMLKNKMHIWTFR